MYFGSSSGNGTKAGLPQPSWLRHQFKRGRAGQWASCYRPIALWSSQRSATDAEIKRERTRRSSDFQQAADFRPQIGSGQVETGGRSGSRDSIGR